MLTLTRARELLQRHGLAARRSLGQHFLVDPNTVRKIVRLAGVRPDETILEIGPGLGSLTIALATAAARVVAVELDEGLARVVRETTAPAGNVEVVVGDALRVGLGRLLGGPGRLVANLPYNVATPILARVLESVPEVTGGLVMVQRELGERWTAGPGSKTFAPISLKVAYYAPARIVADVPRTVFLPPPRVSSVLVAFERHDPPVDVSRPEAFFAFVERAFAHRRKTLRNALLGAGYSGERIVAALPRAGVDPSTRPEQVGLAAFASLWEALGGA